MADNFLSLALEILADPSNAVQAIEIFRAQAKAATADIQSANEATVQSAQAANEATQRVAAAQQEVGTSARSASEQIGLLQKQYADLQADASRLQALPFLSPEAAQGLETDRALMADIRAEAEGLGATMGESGPVSMGIRGQMADLLMFRRLLSATLGLVAIGFYISEWGRISEGIATAAQVLGGYGEAEQEVMKAAIADNEKQLENYKELNAAQLTQLGLIDDVHARKVAELQFEIANATVARQTFVQQRENLQSIIDLHAQQLEQAKAFGPLVQAGTAAWNYYQEKVEGTGKALVKAEDDEKKAGLAILQMNRELKDAQEAYDKTTKSIDKSSNAQERWDEAIATAQVKLPPFIVEIEKLTASIQHQE